MLKMKLLDLQQTFVENIAELIFWSYIQGYQLTFGESFDDDGVGHMKNSNHYIRLAQDFCLFKDGIYLKDSESYKSLGTKWKSIHSLNRWGGDFKNPDGNHFSMEYKGHQ